MCLAVPGEIVEINGNTASVDFGGAKREVQLDLVEKPSKGDYVLVHVGYAIQLLTPEEAEEMINSWNEIAKTEISKSNEKSVISNNER
ncbi:MAG: HypC/HybG/HupF family hydrogenase formation chaperone [Candidatus Hadarchaeota archaeon]